MSDDYAALVTLIRDFLQGAPPSGIRVCELRERDINEPFVYLEHQDGREMRLACSVEDAPKSLALIKGWIARPETFPAPSPEDRFYRGALGWPYRKGTKAAGWDGFDFVPRVTPAS